MSGSPSGVNAATAIEVCHILKEEGFNISDDDVSDALKKYFCKSKNTGDKGQSHGDSWRVDIMSAYKKHCLKSLKNIETSEIYAAIGMVNTKTM